MRTQRPTPSRGLLAGLVALIVFASSAVAMTAGGSSNAPRSLALAAPVQAVESAPTAETRGPDGFRGGGARTVGNDGDGRDGGRRR